jgi:hypothetical protein
MVLLQSYKELNKGQESIQNYTIKINNYSNFEIHLELNSSDKIIVLLNESKYV